MVDFKLLTAERRCNKEANLTWAGANHYNRSMSGNDTQDAKLGRIMKKKKITFKHPSFTPSVKLSLCDSAQHTDCISSIKPTTRTRGQTEGCRVIVLKKQMRQKEKLFSFSIRSVKSSYHLLVVIYPLPKVCKVQTFHVRLPCFKSTTAGFVHRQQLILVGQHCSISFCFVRHLTYLWKSSNIPGGRLPQFKIKNEMYLFIV